MTIKAGDKVHTDYGGPRLTVESVKGEKATCVWWAGDEHRRETFAIERLKEVSPPSTEPLRQPGPPKKPWDVG
jgi:uncharacterized protein YodC (DUF2158 family)